MSVPPPQMPYGAPPPQDSNPYAGGNPYGQPAPPPMNYGYPPAPPASDPAAYGYGYPGGAPQGGPVCRFCGGFPAVEATVRGHQGIIVIMRFLKMRGPFCRVCGDATVRDMSARTLVQGWWGVASAPITIITLLLNLGTHNRFKQLPPPAPGTHGPQLDPGVPLSKRPHMFMLLLPVGWIITVIALIAAGAFAPTNDPYVSHPIVIPSVSVPPMPSFSLPPIPTPTFSLPPDNSGKPQAPVPAPASIDSAKVGDCLRNENGTTATHDPNPRITMLPCTDQRAQYKVLWKYLATSDDKVCDAQPKSDSSYTNDAGSPALSYVLCLQSIHS